MKQKISNQRKTGKFTNKWKLNNLLLKKSIRQKEITGEAGKYLETNEKENKIYKNLWNAVKAVLRWKFLAVNTTEERSQISN